MEYILWSEAKNAIFTKEYENRDDAMRQGEEEFAHISPMDHYDAMFVLKSANPDEGSDNHYDGDIIRRWI